MDQKHIEEQQNNRNKMKRKCNRNKGKKLLKCCCYPCYVASFMLKGIGRCMFVTCYPVLQCFGLDEHRHCHHIKHFDW
ncbi:hypothetical protein Lalb_Chr11g0067761 [Lupinus albus]|uniref:Uncharacterized protein n=1 Tax=Lupinus albus TaxID=3870 RepID=A0A6A4PR43_LUPAL|nr:hypothetical protein Lalb_Chr11g0067761 [Lupinus albus]